MADPIKVDSHAHPYHSREEGQADKDGDEIWEYGSKSGVSFGDRLGIVMYGRPLATPGASIHDNAEVKI